MILKVVPERAGLSATHTRDVHYGYDLRNAQTFARFDSPSGEGMTYAYDAFGRLTSSALFMDGVSRTLAHGYDPGSRRSRVTYPDGAWFDTAYDAASRQTAITDPLGSTLATFSYDPAGYPNGVGRPGATTGLQFRADGPLTSLTHYLAAGLDVQWTFAHNPASQITQRTRSNDAYAPNSAYNVSRNYSVNGLNQYTAAGGASFAYDANGNLTSDGSRTFTYDVENRLVGASGGVSVRYDPLGRLYEVVGASGTTRFLYDGDALVAEYNSGGAMAARYVHGSNAGADVPLLWYPGAGTAASDRRNLLADHQGSIVAISDNAGNRLTVNAYDEWGIPNAANQGRFQYTGQAWIAELGMYHYKARVYSPTLGRFMQVDPIGYDDQTNLYAYVGNDPVNRVDPTGMAECDTGSRIPGGSSGCRVLEGYFIPGAGQGSASGDSSRSHRLGRRLIALMRRDPEVAAAMDRAWRDSCGDCSNPGQKREHGFWLRWTGRDFDIGRQIGGEYTNAINGRTIDLALRDLPGAQIFFHTHPNRVGENGATSIRISDSDRGIASRHNAVVVSVARPHGWSRSRPGRRWFFDDVDTFYVPPSRRRR